MGLHTYFRRLDKRGEFPLELTYRDNYCRTAGLKEIFKRFLVKMFGLDLTLWDQLGFWDFDYRPFSYFSDGEMIANVCLYSMDMLVAGERCRVGQISAVATASDFRREGFSRDLIHRALEWAAADHDFYFLFADEGAFGFYEACGFRSVEERRPRIEIEGRSPSNGAEHLDTLRTDHTALIYRLAQTRSPVSDQLGVLNDKLLMYWCLYGHRDHLYYVADLDALIICARQGSALHVYDVIASTVPPFADFYPYICSTEDDQVEFHFMVDKLQLDSYDHVAVEGSGTHLMGPFPLEEMPFVFPATAQA